MPLPSSGPLTFANIQTEFGGSNPIGLNEYYAGGGLVPSGTSGTYGAVPSSGTISVQNFYGTQSLVPRGVFGGGQDGFTGPTNIISYISMSSTGNATSFGQLTTTQRENAACASSTRGVWIAGSNSDIMQYITIASTGNSITFGSVVNPTVTELTMASSNSTRGIIFGGRSPVTNAIQYITIATTGNSVAFGFLVNGTNYSGSAVASTTRAVMGGGYNTTLEYVTIASTGNGTTFGSMPPTANTIYNNANNGCSNSTRGIFSSSKFFNGTRYVTTNTINYITIATTGNAISFGQLATIRGSMNMCASSVYGVMAGGINEAASDTTYNTIDYVTLASTGNSSAWGVLTANIWFGAGCSNVHGGL